MSRNLFNINTRILNESSQHHFFLETDISTDNLEFLLILFSRMVRYRFRKSCPPLVPLSSLIIITHFKPHIFFLPSITRSPNLSLLTNLYISFLLHACYIYRLPIFFDLIILIVFVGTKFMKLITS
jgi:hypothetical protein